MIVSETVSTLFEVESGCFYWVAKGESNGYYMRGNKLLIRQQKVKGK